MIEADIAAGRLLGERGIGIDLGDEHHDPAKAHIDALAPIRLDRFDDFGAEHALVISRGLFWIGAAQMDMVVTELGHCDLPAWRSAERRDRKSTRLNSSHSQISYA